MINFHSEQAGGYVNLGLQMSPKKTREFAESLLRLEMTQSKEAVVASRKSVYTTLLHLGYDDDWLRSSFLPKFERLLNKHMKKK